MKTILPRDEILALLSTVQDPEIGLNIVDLGLVQALDVSETRIALRLLFTAQACPLRQLIVQWAGDLLTARAVQAVDITIEDEVVWTPDRLTPAGREALGYSA
jgi:metal-sulfur cluster biosynthetic enzyme